MDEKYLISVIVPVYNTEKYLEQCVNSLLHQSYRNLEIILIDDGSTDNSGILCDLYAQKSRRIKVIHSENRGVSHARNLGLAVKNGDYVHFCDSDDWIRPDTYRNLLEKMLYHDADIAFFNSSLESPNAVSRIRSATAPNGVFPKTELSYLMAGKHDKNGRISSYYFSVNNKIYKSSVLNDAAGDPLYFDEDYHYLEDGIFNIYSYHNWNRGITDSRAFYCRRIHPNSAMRKYPITDIAQKMLIGYDRMVQIAEESREKELLEAVQDARTNARLYYFKQAMQNNDVEHCRQWLNDFSNDSKFLQKISVFLFDKQKSYAVSLAKEKATAKSNKRQEICLVDTINQQNHELQNLRLKLSASQGRVIHLESKLKNNNL